MPIQHPFSRRRVHPLALALALALPTAFSAPQRAVALADASMPNRVVGGQRLMVKNCDDDGDGSLRAVYAAAVDGDVVDYSQLQCSTISLTSGELANAAQGATITVVGAAGITVDAGGLSRVLSQAGAKLTLDHVNIANGKYHGAFGGCVHANGAIELRDSSVSHCTLNGHGEIAAGGAIYANTITLKSSTVSSCTAVSGVGAHGGCLSASHVYVQGVDDVPGRGSTISGGVAIVLKGDVEQAIGGGIYATQSVRIVDSTISTNTAASGAGIYSLGEVTLGNSTVSGNYAGTRAGGVLAGALTLDSATIAFNHIHSRADGYGSGVSVNAASTFVNSIIANNYDTSEHHSYDLQTYGATLAGHHNLVLTSSTATVLPTDTLVMDPKLGPLQDNGGLTFTHLPAADSPVLGKGRAAQAFDQRGFDRVHVAEGITDIGAVEVGTAGADDSIFVDGFDGPT
jgi:hypothetical protein